MLSTEKETKDVPNWKLEGQKPTSLCNKMTVSQIKDILKITSQECVPALNNLHVHYSLIPR